jgi:hypothetical protein
MARFAVLGALLDGVGDLLVDIANPLFEDPYALLQGWFAPFA